MVLCKPRLLCFRHTSDFYIFFLLHGALLRRSKFVSFCPDSMKNLFVVSTYTLKVKNFLSIHRIFFSFCLFFPLQNSLQIMQNLQGRLFHLVKIYLWYIHIIFYRTSIIENQWRKTEIFSNKNFRENQFTIEIT